MTLDSIRNSCDVWKYFCAMLKKNICPDIWLKVFSCNTVDIFSPDIWWKVFCCNTVEKYFSWYLIESILQIFCLIFYCKYFRAILQGNIFTDILSEVFCVEKYFSWYLIWVFRWQNWKKSEIFCGLCAGMSPFKALRFQSPPPALWPKVNKMQLCWNLKCSIQKSCQGFHL